MFLLFADGAQTTQAALATAGLLLTRSGSRFGLPTRTLPFLVTLTRSLVPLCVFSFGILFLLILLGPYLPWLRFLWPCSLESVLFFGWFSALVAILPLHLMTKFSCLPANCGAWSTDDRITEYIVDDAVG